MKNKIKKLFIVLMVALVVISGGLLYLFQKRQYFCLADNKCITIWKTSDGCYIVPGKYTSWFKPKDNYIKTTNTNTITIIFDRTSNYDYIIFNAYNKEVDIFMPSYKVKYYDYKHKEEFSKMYYENHKLKEGLKCQPIDIDELW